jgi:phage-related protein
MIKDIDHLQQQGLGLLATKKMKQLTGYKHLYELITNFKGVGYRIIFTVVNGEAWLLEAFKKKSNQTPQRHIDTALGRCNQILQLSA